MEIGEDEESGKWSLDVMFGNALHIEKDMRQVIRDCGFQSEDASKPGYIAFGVNWGYTGAQSSSNLNAESIAAIVALLVLIVFYRLSGYLQCVSDFRCQRYPFLRTVKNDRHDRAAAQADHPAAGSPFIRHWNSGWTSSGIWNRRGTGTGCHGTDELHDSGYKIACVGICGSSTFSLVTVFLSCNKPGRIAAKSIPGRSGALYGGRLWPKKAKAAKKPASLGRMAWANVGRNRKKTVLVVISLSLAVVLLNLTVMFANGFDMDLYLKHFCVSDFMFANADYFNVQKRFHSSDEAVEDSAMQTVLAQNGVKESGCVYGQTTWVLEKIKKKRYAGVFYIHGTYHDKRAGKGLFQLEGTGR